ncbi:hypothetical protein BDV93DRAFT_507759 [Ceratobasidium sp. AG-I]|nr:hypothetical protein BDV93DRAFT_507759 [Ceratobasidium sp. AG-I]
MSYYTRRCGDFDAGSAGSAPETGILACGCGCGTDQTVRVSGMRVAGLAPEPRTTSLRWNRTGEAQVLVQTAKCGLQGSASIFRSLLSNRLPTQDVNTTIGIARSAGTGPCDIEALQIVLDPEVAKQPTELQHAIGNFYKDVAREDPGNPAARTRELGPWRPCLRSRLCTTGSKHQCQQPDLKQVARQEFAGIPHLGTIVPRHICVYLCLPIRENPKLSNEPEVPVAL